MLQIQTPSGSPDVTRRNARETIYIKGDEDTDGSLRLVPDEVIPANMEAEIREEGVWNTTGLTVSGSTVRLGRDLKVSAFGEFIKTFDVFVDEDQLSPHIHFNKEGTLETGYFADLDPFIEVVVQPDDSAEVAGPVIEFISPPGALERITESFDLKAGSVAPTGNVLLTSWRAGFDVGDPFVLEQYPASVFDVAEGELINILFRTPIQFGDLVSYARFETDDNSDMSLKFEPTLTTPYSKINYWPVTEDPIFTFLTSSKALSSQAGNLLVDQNGDMVFANVSF